MDPRKILGVTADATHEEIQKAYHSKARKHHPDLGGDVWAFQQVQAAFEQLSNPSHALRSREKKAAYAEPPRTKTETNPEPDLEEQQTNDDGPWWYVFTRELPFQNETTAFVLVNCLDIFATYTLLRFGRMPGAKSRAIEANPIARFFMDLWGFNGMAVFKLFVVAVICIIAQIVATQNMRLAKGLLYVGIVIVGAVVAYSLILFAYNFM